MRKKKFFLMLLVNMVVIFNCSFAQKMTNEATINYSISAESTNGKAAMAKSLAGATLTIYIKGAQSRSDMASGLGTESNLYDSKLGKGTILKQYSGQKLMIMLTADNWAQKNRFYQNIKFSIDNSVQTIAGFKCKKATGQSADGKTIVIYFTPDVALSNKQYDNSFTQLPGLPVQYELEAGKLKFKYTLSSISYEPVPATKFEVPKTGFRIMTYEETQQLHKGDK